LFGAYHVTFVNTSLRAPTESDYLHVASWITDAAACRRWAGPRVAFPFSALGFRAFWQRLYAALGWKRDDEFCGYGLSL
jgi:hypothetical protein